MTKLAEDEFSKTGLAPTYAFVLMAVNSYPGIQPKELSEHLQLTPSTVTRLVEKMEFKGFVNRKISGRHTEIFPTPKSLEINEQIKSAWGELNKRYSSLIGEADGRDLTEKINQAIEKIIE
ncbi:MAG: winged helix-turn-helix transcriptional regulator [Bacteroidales bacterium]|nr:winged helix-turn-helix transcriptional regulator [Bacteroidales bacterium]